MPEANQTEPEPEREARGRGIWSGTISFGLVSVPVDLLPAVRSTRPRLRMLDPSGTPLSRRYFCPDEDRELSGDEIVRGFEVEPEEFVLVTDEELDALAPDKSRDIALERFVPRQSIEPHRFDRPYYLVPSGESARAYRLLAAVMERSGRAGIATFVMRGSEYLVAIVAQDGILRAETLRFSEQLRTAEGIGLPARRKGKAELASRYVKAIRAETRDEFEPGELGHHEEARLVELIESARGGNRIVVDPEVRERPTHAEIVDLMQVLKQRLGHETDKPAGRRRTAGRKPPKRAPAKPARARRRASRSR